ncbi:MAG: sigma-70 family RNA polymerase sigma factor [Planctomycetes bacterium]|nr:sigma-70 family RNA polymerase sigma factor [Planctomycetota bacterium]
MHRPTRDQFEALVRDHHAAVHRSARRWLGADAALDVTQDVFVRVLEGKVRLATAHEPRAVLCWLATRLAANRRRSERRRQRHEEDAMMQTEDHNRTAPDPAQLAAADQLQRHVHELVDALPDDLRLPLQLHCQDRLSFAEVGLALRVPTSTAHDRVQQALRRLRTALVGRGITLAAAGLPQLVADLRPPVPVGLEQRLLALGDGAAAVGSGFAAKVALGAAALLTTVAIGAFAWWGQRPAAAPAATVVLPAAASAGTTPAVATAPQEPAGRPPVPSVRTEAPPPPSPVPSPGSVREWRTAVFHGSVRDAAAWPVAGARVEAVAAGGLKAMELGAVTTGADGRFWLELGPHTLAPSAVRLRVLEDGRLLLETDELALPRAAEAPSLELVLPAAVGIATARYELTVEVAAADGSVLPAVPVQLLGDAVPAPRPGQSPPEAEASTDRTGSARLRGRGLGAKWLFVDGRSAGQAAAFVPLALDRAGPHFHRVVLPVGGRLDVQIGRLDGQPLEWANVWLEHEASGLLHRAELVGDGRASFAGLGAGHHTLHVTSDWNLSPAQRRGLAAGDPLVTVQLKRRDDERAVGDCMAELHGELVDAGTGTVVEWTGFEVDVLPLRAGVSTLPTDWLQPRGPFQTMVTDDRYTRFHEVGLAAGRHGIVVTVPGYATTVVPVELRAGEVRTGLRVPLRRGGTVRGRVVDERGQPVESCTVMPVGFGELGDRIVAGWRALQPGDADQAPEPCDPPRRFWTDAEGRFELTGVQPDVELRLVAHRRQGGIAVGPALVVRDGETQAGIELVLEPR